MRRLMPIVWASFQRFTMHDAWAIASHISLSLLMALFPFLIVLTALASLVGQTMLATEAVDMILDGWPRAVADPIAHEVHAILTGDRSGIVTFGAIFALYFSSSGVEALRIGLNRAYGVRDRRSWWVMRLESICYVIAGAVLLLAVAFLVVLGPQVLQALIGFWPHLADLLPQWDAGSRLLAATAIIVISVVAAHKAIPAGTRSLVSVIPGIVVTFALWLVVTLGFGWYLAMFPKAYSSTYGGLATAMVALVFLNMLSASFLYGGEINGLLSDMRRRGRNRSPQAGPAAADT